MDIEDELNKYDGSGPDIIESEVEWALNDLPIGKPLGVDIIPAEMKLYNHVRIYVVLVYGLKIFSKVC